MQRLSFAGNKPLVMGILNVTPDSFSDGGQFNSVDSALLQTDLMLAQGADIIDVGGESTRPNAEPVSIQEELDRVMPVIAAIKQRFDIPISIDTRRAQVMQAAVANGAQMVNDVTALQDPAALAMVATLQVPVCLMHMQGEPRTMQQNPVYTDVFQDIYDFLHERIQACESAGIVSENIIIDPGFGFGKTYEHNLTLLRSLKKFLQLKKPVLVGLSRKAWIGIATHQGPAQRVYGSIAAAILAVQQGAHILRVHDVGATQDALRVWHAVNQGTQTHE